MVTDCKWFLVTWCCILLSWLSSGLLARFPQDSTVPASISIQQRTKKHQKNHPKWPPRSCPLRTSIPGKRRRKRKRCLSPRFGRSCLSNLGLCRVSRRSEIRNWSPSLTRSANLCLFWHLFPRPHILILAWLPAAPHLLQPSPPPQHPNTVQLW